MCGRYLLEATSEQLKMRFDSKNNYVGYGTKKEIFPTDVSAVIIRKDNQNSIEAFKWGFNAEKPLINARGESVAEKATFENSFLNGRCIIPATNFFEWKANGKEKIKFQIAPKDIDIFSMAGLYKMEIGEDGNVVSSFVIITISANEEMSSIHHRMPVILTKNEEKLWLDNSIKNPYILKGLIKSYRGSLSINLAEAFLQTRLL